MTIIDDLQGNYVDLLYKITKLGLTDTTLIQVGDFGLGFHDLNYDIQTLTGLNNFLIKSNNILYIIRSNDDNPFFWENCHELDFTNIFFAQEDQKTYGGKKGILLKCPDIGENIFFAQEDQKTYRGKKGILLKCPDIGEIYRQPIMAISD